MQKTHLVVKETFRSASIEERKRLLQGKMEQYIRTGLQQAAGAAQV